jgi:hypothetical protein
LWVPEVPGRGVAGGASTDLSAQGIGLRGSALPRLSGDSIANSLLPSEPGRTGWSMPEAGQLRPERTESQKAWAEEFRQLLEAPSGRLASPSNPNDPINLLDDASRQQINPVTGQLPGALPLVIERRDGLDPLHRFSPLERPKGLSPLPEANTRVLGSSSLSPAIVTPPQPALTPAQPTVLEIPKRKF